MCHTDSFSLWFFFSLSFAQLRQRTTNDPIRFYFDAILLFLILLVLLIRFHPRVFLCCNCILRLLLLFFFALALSFFFRSCQWRIVEIEREWDCTEYRKRKREKKTKYKKYILLTEVKLTAFGVRKLESQLAWGLLCRNFQLVHQ